MPNLAELYLAKNRITSLNGLADLPALKKLHVRENQIAGFGEGLPDLPALQYLNMRDNKIDKDAPEVDKCSEIEKLGSLRSLCKLNMQGNPYADAIEDMFKREVLIALDKLNWESINKDEVVEEDRTDAKEEKLARIRAAEEAAEEARLAALEAEKAKAEAEDDD